MIICFGEKINSFDKKSSKNFKKDLEKIESYEEKGSYIQSSMPRAENVLKKKCSCPCCHAQNSFIKYGTYERNVSILNGDTVENYVVTVQRVQCTSCGHTHALLPDFIVPYKIMAVPSIAEIVSRAVCSSAYKISETIEISYQTIYAFIALVLSFFGDFKVLNNKNEYIKPKNFNEKYFLTNCVKLSSSKYSLDFFEFYNWILFMQKFRNNPSPPVTISISKVSPT